jgi:hypothetical protein
MQYGPQAALIAESFTPRLRYSGTPIAIYILITAIISIIATSFLKDYTGKDVSAEYDA